MKNKQTHIHTFQNLIPPVRVSMQRGREEHGACGGHVAAVQECGDTARDPRGAGAGARAGEERPQVRGDAV